MIVRRKTWLYRRAGQRFVHSITFKSAVTAARVREVLSASVGTPLEIWGRSSADVPSFR